MVPRVVTTVSPNRLTDPQRKQYHKLRVATLETMLRYAELTQTRLAKVTGLTQGYISHVLRGQTTSLPALEAIVRAVLANTITVEERRRLGVQLAETIALLREHRPRPPRARPPR